MGKRVSRRLRRCVGFAAWLCVHSFALADTVTLVAAEDATISEQEPGLALGGDTSLKSGTPGPMAGEVKNRALLKFDFANRIPRDAIITSAALTLTVVQTPPTTDQVWFRLHEVLSPWSEAAVTWMSRLASSTESAWSVPGGAPSVDYAVPITQSCLITGLAKFTFASNPEMVADVQEWVSNPSHNAGWLLLCASEDLERSVRKFGSREAADPTSRPALMVEFRVPPAAPVLTVLPQMNGEFQFEFNGSAGTSYSVEYATELAADQWLELRTFAALPVPTTLLVSDVIVAGGHRFYRVRTR